MFALLGAPEVRHQSAWESAGEAERMAHRQLWGRAASTIVDRLIEMAARVQADEDDEEDHDPALEAAAMALETMMADDPWRIADTSSIRVGSAIARLRRELSPAAFERLRYAHRLAALVKWRHVGVPHAQMSTKSIWGSFVANVAYRNAKRWWPYLLQRIAEGRFKDCWDEQRTLELLQELERIWRRMTPEHRRISDLDTAGLDALLERYRCDDLSADELVELVAILQKRGRESDAPPPRRDALRVPKVTLTALAPHWPSLPRLVREETLRMLHRVPVPLRPRLEALLLRLWTSDRRGMAWLRIKQAVQFNYINADDILLLHHDAAGAVLGIPKGCRTPAAAILLGQNLSWCTARSDTNWFDYYIGEGPLFVLVTPAGRRAQLQLETLQFMDCDNTRVRLTTLHRYQALIDAWGARYTTAFTLEVPTMKRLRRTLECYPGQMLTFAVLVQAGMLQRPAPSLIEHWLESLQFDARNVMIGFEGFVSLAEVGFDIPDHVVRRAVMALVDTGTGTPQTVNDAFAAMKKAGIDVDRALAGSHVGTLAARLWGWSGATWTGARLQPMAYIRRLSFEQTKRS